MLQDYVSSMKLSSQLQLIMNNVPINKIIEMFGEVSELFFCMKRKVSGIFKFYRKKPYNYV